MSITTSRRSVLLAAGASSLAVSVPLLAASPRGTLAVDGLEVNNVANPMGVNRSEVRLSWRLQAQRRRTRQTAYQVQVASSAEKLQRGDFDLWDSGRVAGDRSIDVRYAGRPLPSRQSAHWQVRVWDNHGQQAQSPPSHWEMGLLTAADWQARWLAVESEIMRDDRAAGLVWLGSDTGTDAEKSRQFRLVFELPDAAEVTLFTAAGSPYQALLDAEPLSLPALAATAWGKQGTVSLRRSLGRGRHVLALSVAANPRAPRSENAHLQAAMLVRAELASGTVLRFDGRQARTSGESSPAWATAAFDDSAWPIASFAEDRQAAPPGAGAFLLRREFQLHRAIRSARLYVTALGAYEVQLNGKRVGDDQLAPEFTDFSKRVLYRVHDVTGLLAAGDNAIGAWVGDGWYGSYAAPAGRFAFGPPPLRLLAQLEITHDNGELTVVRTDDQWQISRSPIISSEIYDGEDYDARLEQPGWAQPGFKPARAWTSARLAPSVTGRLEGMFSPPIRRVATLPARRIQRIGSVSVVDFGQNFAGWAKLRVTGRSGDRITLRFAEVLKADGNVDQSNLRGARASDTYLVRGDPAGETFEPRFTYHGFRYVEVSGLTGALQPQDIQGIVVHSDLPETGRLRIGNPLIMQLWQNTRWSQRSNFMGIPTDCPQRDERLGWMGDANVFWDAAAFNMNVAALTERFAGDIRDAQRSDGAFTDVSPDTLHGPGAPGWADAGVILPWTAFRRYGDTAIIDQHWDAMVRYIDYVIANSEAHLWTRSHGSDYGDWLSLDSKYPGDATTPKNLLATAVFKHSVDAVAEMAAATGRKEAETRYRQLSADIRAAFIKAYVQPDGVVSNDSQTAYILALRYDLLPAELRAAAAAKLHANIVRRGNLLTTGFLGTPGSLDALSDFGYGQSVYDLLLRTEYPSWGHMVEKGATTIWERWNGDVGDVAMNSYNHYSLGAVTGFVFRRIAGLSPTDPGFRTFEVNPVLDPRVSTGGGEYDSAMGRLSTDWKLGANGSFQISVTVPPNVTARIHLPTKDPTKINEGGRSIAAHPDVTTLAPVADRVVVQVGSGTYQFSVRGG